MTGDAPIFTKSDVQHLKMLKSVINKAKFEVEGDAVIKVALLLKWYDELEGKLERYLSIRSVGKIENIESGDSE